MLAYFAYSLPKTWYTKHALPSGSKGVPSREYWIVSPPTVNTKVFLTENIEVVKPTVGGYHLTHPLYCKIKLHKKLACYIILIIMNCRIAVHSHGASATPVHFTASIHVYKCIDYMEKCA